MEIRLSSLGDHYILQTPVTFFMQIPCHFSHSCDLIPYDGYIFHDYASIVCSSCLTSVKSTFSEPIEQKMQQFLTSNGGFKFRSENFLQHYTVLFLYFYFNCFYYVCIETCKPLSSLKTMKNMFHLVKLRAFLKMTKENASHNFCPKNADRSMHKIVNTLHNFQDNELYENNCGTEVDSRIYLKVKGRWVGVPHTHRKPFYNRLTNIYDSYDYTRCLKQNRFKNIYWPMNKVHVIVQY